MSFWKIRPDPGHVPTTRPDFVRYQFLHAPDQVVRSMIASACSELRHECISSASHTTYGVNEMETAYKSSIACICGVIDLMFCL
jgi:hypothetical protein